MSKTSFKPDETNQVAMAYVDETYFAENSINPPVPYNHIQNTQHIQYQQCPTQQQQINQMIYESQQQMQRIIQERDQRMERNILSINKNKNNLDANNPSAEHILIFDWDDTLLPSHALQIAGLRPSSKNPDVQKVKKLTSSEKKKWISDLKTIEINVYNLLHSSLQHVGQNNVIIITNAEKGWVELSCSTFLPNVYHLLARCRIISARSAFEKDYPKQTVEWKRRAIKLVLDDILDLNINLNQEQNQENQENESNFDENDLNKSSQFNQVHVISFGDSLVERQALFDVTRCIKGRSIKTKSIKFVPSPTSTDLIDELKTINSSLLSIIKHPHDMDYKLSFLR